MLIFKKMEFEVSLFWNYHIFVHLRFLRFKIFRFIVVLFSFDSLMKTLFTWHPFFSLSKQTYLSYFFITQVFLSYRIRIAGIRGIQGVVRKTVNDELRATIWEPQHMDKIVPSLLFNMQKIEEVDRY